MDLSDPVKAVLLDFENVIWLTTLIGLALFGAWRFFFRSGDASPETDDETDRLDDVGLVEEGESPAVAKKARETGVPVSHFNFADLCFLPLVLVKYSLTLQLLGGKLFAFPGQAAEKAGLVQEAPDAAQLTEPVPLQMSVELILVDMAINFFLIGVIFLMIQWVGRRDLGTVFGFDRFRRMSFPQRWLWPAVWVLAGAIIATPTIIVVSNLMPRFFEGIFGEEIGEQAAVQNMRESTDWVLRVLLILNACLVAPLVEELVFRGYFYGILKRYTGAMFSAFITGAIFAVAHQSLLALIPLWGFALFLTLFYESSRSLWVPIGIHAVFNTVNVVLILLGVGGDGL